MPAARHDPDALPVMVPAPACAGPADLGSGPDCDLPKTAVRAPAAPETITAREPSPAPQSPTPEPLTASSASLAPRKKYREFIPAVTSHGQISGLCNTGRHYECTGCRCGCHPPFTAWRN